MPRGEIKSLLFADGIAVTAATAAPTYVALITDTTGWTGSVNSVTYDVSSYGITSSKDFFWQLQDLSSNNYMQIGAEIDFPTATTVRVTTGDNLPVGTYRLLGR